MHFILIVWKVFLFTFHSSHSHTTISELFLGWVTILFSTLNVKPFSSFYIKFKNINSIQYQYNRFDLFRLFYFLSQLKSLVRYLDLGINTGAQTKRTPMKCTLKSSERRKKTIFFVRKLQKNCTMTELRKSYMLVFVWVQSREKARERERQRAWEKGRNEEKSQTNTKSNEFWHSLKAKMLSTHTTYIRAQTHSHIHTHRRCTDLGQQQQQQQNCSIRFIDLSLRS